MVTHTAPQSGSDYFCRREWYIRESPALTEVPPSADTGYTARRPSVRFVEKRSGDPASLVDLWTAFIRYIARSAS